MPNHHLAHLTFFGFICQLYLTKLKKINHMIQQLHCWVYVQELIAGSLRGYVHRNILYNSQKVEATQMFVDEQIKCGIISIL